jgi:hypothetical protein
VLAQSVIAAGGGFQFLWPGMRVLRVARTIASRRGAMLYGY